VLDYGGNNDFSCNGQVWVGVINDSSPLVRETSIKELSPTELCLTPDGRVEAWENVGEDIRVGGVGSH